MLLFSSFVGLVAAATAEASSSLSPPPPQEMPIDTLGHGLWEHKKKNDTDAAPYKDTRLVIQIPFQHHDKNGEEHEVARWGGANVPWSGTLAEFVYYYDQPLCYDHIDFNSTYFPFYPKNKSDNKEAIRPFILMAPPGSCSPVLWARRAQHVGAAALMVADDRCQCNDKACTDKYTAENCRTAGQPVLINDGTAGDVSIPVWLVPKMVGQVLIDSVVKDDQPVLVDYSWGLPQNETDCGTHCDDNKKNVTYHLWTAAAHDPQLTATNIKELQQVVTALGDKVTLVPKFRLLDGTHFNCPSFTDPSSSPCDHLCTNGGRYCAVHQKDLSGHAVVREALRRLCIWKHYDSHAYWEYWVHHATMCKGPHQYASEECLKKGMEQAKIDPTIVDDCMKESGETEKDETNALLQTMIEEQKLSGVVQLPTITHADTMVPLDHGASAHALFESVCVHYYWRAKGTNLHWEDIPSVCGPCFECVNLMGCLEAGECVAFDDHDNGGENKPPKDKSYPNQRRRRRRWHFFWFLVVCGLAGYGYYYYRQQQEGMYNGGSGGGLLGSYMQLSGTD